MRNKKYIAVYFVLIILQGCLNPLSPLMNPPSVPPQAAIDEIKTYGVTLSNEDRPFPEFAGTEVRSGDTPYVHLRLGWYFSPHPEYSQGDFKSINGSINGIPKEDFNFSYSFIVDDGVTSTTIPSTNGFSVDNPLDSYPGSVKVRYDPKQFVTNGNIVLQAREVSIPLNATHIEISMQHPVSKEQVAISKVSLDKLTAWQKYVKPLIDDQ